MALSRLDLFDLYKSIYGAALKNLNNCFHT